MQKSKYTKIQNKTLKMQNKKWPRMEICFRESKEILLYGMKKYCVSEGLVNLNEAIYDYGDLWWPFENLQKPTPTHKNQRQTYANTHNLRQTYANAQNLR